MRIAFWADNWLTWGGGIETLRFFIHSLRHTSLTADIDVVVVISRGFLQQYHKQFVGLLDMIGVQVKVLCYPQLKAEMGFILKRHRIDVLLASLRTLGKDFPVPWVGFVNDFQRKYYPEYWTTQEILSRETECEGAMVYETPAVICHSHSVRCDLEKFYPGYICKAFVLPFGAVLKPQWLAERHSDILQKYQLNRKFFIICNQFWVHKDYPTAFRALKELLGNYPQEIDLVCTGATQGNSKYPHYFEKLQTVVQELHVTERVHLLGFIPKDDQIELLKHAIGLIQPTLFEGSPGSQSVAEAVALGIPCIISDLPVNREVIGEHITYFQPGSYQELARCMLERLKDPVGNCLSEEQKTSMAEDTTIRFAKVLVEAAKYVVKPEAGVKAKILLTSLTTDRVDFDEQWTAIQWHQLDGTSVYSVNSPPQIAQLAGRFCGVMFISQPTQRDELQSSPAQDANNEVLAINKVKPIEERLPMFETPYPVTVLGQPNWDDSVLPVWLEQQIGICANIVQTSEMYSENHRFNKFLYICQEGFRLHKFALAMMAKALETNHADCVVCMFQRIGRDGKPFGGDIQPLRRQDQGFEQWSNAFGTIMYRTEAVYHRLVQGKQLAKTLPPNTILLDIPLAKVDLTTFVQLCFPECNKNKRLYIYAAGDHTKSLLRNIDCKKFNIGGIIDRNPELTGQELAGYPIYGIDKVIDPAIDYILISSDVHEQRIYQELAKVVSKHKLLKMYDRYVNVGWD